MSIKFKIWFAIAATAIATIGAVWLLQVVFLEDYYIKLKKDEFADIVNTAVTAINSEGIINSGETLYDLAAQFVLCIEMSDGNGMPIVKYEGLNYNCYIHKGKSDHSERGRFIEKAQANQYVANTLVVEGAKRAKEYFVCSYFGTTDDTVESDDIIDMEGRLSPVSNSGDYMVIISMALAPVREASKAIRNQFLTLSVAILAVSMVIAIIISHWLTKNIMKINAAAKEVAKGNLDVDVAIRSNDELGDLSRSFSEMTKEISKVNILQKELVANISHDLRTPLTMIKGYAETIKDITGDDKEQREKQLDIIIGETNRLSVLVSDVMDLSLMQAGQLQIKSERFNITERIREILSRFQLLEHTDGFEFLLEAEGECWVEADPVRIEQVLYNLINNAVNHIGDTKRIIVRVIKTRDEVMIEVEDTGVGIAQEDLPLIWDRYYKPYKNTERKAVGTGLGLSIVKAILQKHGSRFGVRSSIGVGSCFWFTLRAADGRLLLTEKSQ